MVARQEVPPSYVVPLHVHEHDDEIFIMLTGELTVSGPMGEVRIGVGTGVELPRGIPHGFRNHTDAPSGLMVLAQPGVQALEMFRHFDRAGADGTKLSPAEIEAIANQYGVRFV